MLNVVIFSDCAGIDTIKLDKAIRGSLAFSDLYQIEVSVINQHVRGPSAVFLKDIMLTADERAEVELAVKTAINHAQFLWLC